MERSSIAANIRRASRPLSIVQFATGFPGWGGAELHLLNLAQQLKYRGHDVTVACLPGKFIEQRAGELGLKTAAFRVGRLWDMQDFGAIRRYLHENHVDVVHAHCNSDVHAAGASAMLEHVPVRLLTRHLPYGFKNKMGSLIYSSLLFRKIITVSDSVRLTMLATGTPASRLRTIHHGTDVQQFQNVTSPAAVVRAELGLPHDTIAIGILGRIAVEKGHKYLIDAVDSLENNGNLRIVVVGNGPYDAEVKQQVADLGLHERVSFLGFRSDVNNIINAMDIVAVPSTWDEPCSAVIQQAMALRKPVIGTQSGGSPEMIVHGVTGLLAPPSDAVALAEAIQRLSTDAQLREQMGAEGVQRVEAKFTLAGMVDKIEDLYDQELVTAPWMGRRICGKEFVRT